MRTLVLGLFGLILLIISELLLVVRHHHSPLSLIGFVANNDVYLIQPDGNNRRFLTRPAGIPANLDWLDVNLTFLADGIHKGRLYAIHPSGAGEHRLLSAAEPIEGALISPDENWVAFYYSSPPILEIMSTAHRTGVVFDGLPDQKPTIIWVNDYLLCACGQSLQRFDPDGNHSIIASIDDAIDDIALAPDASILLYTVGNRLYHMTLATGERSMLVEEPGSITWPSWSPDGQWIAYVTHRPSVYRDGSSELYLIRPDGTNLWRMTEFFEVTSPLSWSPDGRWLVFVSSHLGQSAIYRVHIESGTIIPITDTHAHYRQPVWSDELDYPHHASLLFMLGASLFAVAAVLALQ